MPKPGRFVSAAQLRAVLIGAAIWLVVSLASAAQGYVFALYHDRVQHWWPTFGYTAAIFAVWGLLAPVMLKLMDRIAASWAGRVPMLALWVVGYPLATALHIALFVLLFWPVYGTAAATPFAMARSVLLANIDTSLFAYLALGVTAAVRKHRRAAATAAPSARPPETQADDLFWVRRAGGLESVPLGQIDWIAAAGDYAELHVDGRTLLADDSLTALSRRLPTEQFARIHRGAIVRIDRVREVRRLGRGDAALILVDGRTLRLSRRYRANVTAHLPF